jgi:PPK2 family polyphosphate:nucleotide phosphotransferase
MKTEHYRVEPGDTVDLTDIPTRDDGGLDKDQGKSKLKELLGRLDELQEVLFAGRQRAVLVIFQAMDAGGKDSTIHKVLGPLNPQGVRVWNFKGPSEIELAHDYLWRIHQRVPARGYIGVFNRSHYEDVLIVRVKDLVPKETWSRRYDHINGFERMLHDEGVVVRKFYLHISSDYQKRRLQRRLDRPDKHWKFNPDDLAERRRWGAYRKAFEEAMTRCSTKHAPWYVIPAERRWFRNLLVASVLVETLESLDLRYPERTFDPEGIVVE